MLIQERLNVSANNTPKNIFQIVNLVDLTPVSLTCKLTTLQIKAAPCQGVPTLSRKEIVEKFTPCEGSMIS